MKIGDIDGKSKVYDENGKPILQSGERIEKTFPGMSKSWAAEYHRNMREVFLTGTQGVHFEGEFTVTNKRIIFLAEPKHFHAGFNAIGIWGSSMGNFQYVMNRSNLAKERKAKMYFEFDCEELIRIEVGFISSYIYVRLPNGKSFRFVFDKESGRMLRDMIFEK
jgi:hypothetical protein